MGKTIALSFNYDRGMRRDHSREQLPRGSAWDLVDYLPSVGAPLRKRGGWLYASPTLPGQQFVAAAAYVPYRAGPRLVAFGNTGNLFDVGPTFQTNKGAAVVPFQTSFHKELLIIPDSTGASSPKTYSGSTLGTLSSAPKARFTATWNERTIAGGVPGAEYTVYFSNPGDPQGWDTGNAWQNASFPLMGFAVLSSVILLFSPVGVERFRGSAPPPGGNLIREWVSERGCIDPRSIAIWKSMAIWANTDGIFLTDGAVVSDLLRSGEMSQYWTQVVTSQTPPNAAGWTFSGVVWQDYYIMSVLNGATPVDTLLCDLTTRSWFRITNVFTMAFAASTAAAEELYFGLRDEPRLASGSSMWDPKASNKNDADGHVIMPILETAFTPLGPETRLRNVFLGHLLKDVTDENPALLSDNPSLTVGFVTSPEDTSYESLNPSIYHAPHYRRSKIPVRRRANGFGFRVAQEGPSADTRLFGFELEGYPLEQTRP